MRGQNGEEPRGSGFRGVLERGRAAVRRRRVPPTGTVSIESIVLFLIIFLWTPPHFWALALYKQGDYGAAGIPMLPNVAGEKATRRQILIYSVILVATTFVPNFIHMSGCLYGAVAVIAGASFLYLAWKLYRAPDQLSMKKVARSLFTYSLSYLAVIFFALLTDHVGMLLGWVS